MRVFSVWLESVFAFLTIGLILQRESVASMADRFELVGERMNVAMAETECKRRGFDGLAVLSTPEEFNYAMQASVQLR